MGAAGRDAPTVGALESVGAAAIFLGGVLWHFVYDWSGHSRIVAAIAPANESVWEHLKLVVLPVTVLGLVEMRWVYDRPRLWWAKLLEIGAACSVIVGVFYTYTGALGVDSIIVVDIASFVAAVVVGQWLSYRVLRSDRRVPPVWVSVSATLLVIVGFAVLTFVPPHIPLFQQASTGAYGPA